MQSNDMVSIPQAGPSSPRKSYSNSPSIRSKPFGSSDALSPELPPTYNSLGTHVDARRGSLAHVEDETIDTERGRLLSQVEGDGKGKSRRSSDELDALRLDLDGIGQSTTTRTSGEDESTRLAMTNIDQRKALWWKNVLITGLFIASWYVPD
jgi:hypothetical protein